MLLLLPFITLPLCRNGGNGNVMGGAVTAVTDNGGTTAVIGPTITVITLPLGRKGVTVALWAGTVTAVTDR